MEQHRNVRLYRSRGARRREFSDPHPDAITGGFPQLQNGVVPFFLALPTSTTGGVMQGAYTETQG